MRLLLEHALDVLDDDDGVVDDDADRQHQGEERNGVGRIAERQEDREGADQAHRHGDRGNEGRAQIAEEDEHDEDDEHERLAERLQHLADRVADEERRIVDDDPLHAGREAGLQFRERRGRELRGFDRVGAGREVERDADAGLAVDARLVVLVLRAHLDPRHVADAQQRAVGIGAQHDLGEIRRRLEAPFGLDVHLKLLVVADRPRADAADRRLHVLRLDRADDVARREIEVGQTIGVEPDAHRVVEPPEQQRPGRRPATRDSSSSTLMVA